MRNPSNSINKISPIIPPFTLALLPASVITSGTAGNVFLTTYLFVSDLNLLYIPVYITVLHLMHCILYYYFKFQWCLVGKYRNVLHLTCIFVILFGKIIHIMQI